MSTRRFSFPSLKDRGCNIHPDTSRCTVQCRLLSFDTRPATDSSSVWYSPHVRNTADKHSFPATSTICVIHDSNRYCVKLPPADLHRCRLGYEARLTLCAGHQLLALVRVRLAAKTSTEWASAWAAWACTRHQGSRHAPSRRPPEAPRCHGSRTRPGNTRGTESKSTLSSMSPFIMGKPIHHHSPPNRHFMPSMYSSSLPALNHAAA